MLHDSIRQLLSKINKHTQYVRFFRFGDNINNKYLSSKNQK